MPIERVVCCGGIAEKNDLFMQIYADVIGQPMLIAGSPQTPALGSADFGRRHGRRRRGRLRRTGPTRRTRMTTLKDKRFSPDPAAHAVYDELYAIYRELHDAFGGVPGARGDLATVMKRLLAHQGARGRAASRRAVLSAEST